MKKTNVVSLEAVHTHTHTHTLGILNNKKQYKKIKDSFKNHVI